MQLHREGLHEGDGERLAGAVGGLVGKRLHSSGGGDGDHASAAALDHSGEEGVGEGDDGLAVDPDHLGLALGVELEEAAAQTEAGVVHQQVHVDPELFDLAGKLRGLGSEVALDHVGRRRELLRQLLEPVLSARDQDQVVAPRGELPRELLADAR